MTTENTSPTIPPQMKLSRRQREVLLGQIVAVSTVAREVYRELMSVPTSSTNYGEPVEIQVEPGFAFVTGLTNVRYDARQLCQAANNLLRSIAYMPIEDDPAETPE